LDREFRFGFASQDGPVGTTQFAEPIDLCGAP
jgi:hypothetical protein